MPGSVNQGVLLLLFYDALHCAVQYMTRGRGVLRVGYNVQAHVSSSRYTVDPPSVPAYPLLSLSVTASIPILRLPHTAAAAPTTIPRLLHTASAPTANAPNPHAPPPPTAPPRQRPSSGHNTLRYAVSAAPSGTTTICTPPSAATTARVAGLATTMIIAYGCARIRSCAMKLPSSAADTARRSKSRRRCVLGAAATGGLLESAGKR